MSWSATVETRVEVTVRHVGGAQWKAGLWLGGQVTEHVLWLENGMVSFPQNEGLLWFANLPDPVRTRLHELIREATGLVLVVMP